MSASSVRIVVALLEDEPGVLNRVSSLFRRRNFNILSLNVGRTHLKGVSRLTLVVDADDDTAKRIEANLYKLVNVLEVRDLTRTPALVRDLLLIKVRATPERRGEVLHLAEVFRARVVDIGEESLVLELTGSQDKIEGLTAVLQPFGILEMAQSGVIAMTRGASPLARTAPDLD